MTTYEANLAKLAEWGGVELDDLRIAKLFNIDTFHFDITARDSIELPDDPIEQKLEQLVGLGLIEFSHKTLWRRYYLVTC
jgi:hypothetical protein